MVNTMIFKFKSKIYKTGINACVDVPKEITDKMEPQNGYVKVNGEINKFKFSKNLVPVKNRPYRLFANIPMLKGGNANIGDTAEFKIEQSFDTNRAEYLIPGKLKEKLEENSLMDDFNNLTESRKKDILKYLNYIKTEETLDRNIEKLIGKLKGKEKNIRIP
jgi:hypothetical protein